MISRFAMMTTVLFLALGSTAQAQVGALTDELRTVRNIVNNNLPERYRASLNRALDRVEVAAERQCGGDMDPAPDAPVCDLDFHTGGYWRVVRNGEPLSSYTTSQGNALELLKKFRTQRVCL